MHALRARLPVLLAVLLVALPAGAAGRHQYFCEMMGRLLDTCCCAAAKASATSKPNAGPEFRAKDCCERIESATRDAIPALRDGALRIESPVVGTLAPIAFVVPAPSFELLSINRVRARAPPALGPPIFLKNCSLLT
jgi:hypothetical protein